MYVKINIVIRGIFHFKKGSKTGLNVSLPSSAVLRQQEPEPLFV